jgi:hypothetical protein
MNPIIASSSSIVIRAQGAYSTLNNIKNPKLNPPPQKKEGEILKHSNNLYF